MKERPSRILRFFRVINALLILGTFGVAGFVYGGFESVRAVLPEDADLTRYKPLGTTEIYSTERNPDGTIAGHTLLARIAKEDRTPVELSRIPIHLQQATVAIEDERFFEHRGVDPKGIIRAALANLRSGRIEQGGSTITQQLVKNVWLSQERTIDRKLKEIMLALQFETKFSKDEILEMYLNEVYYGHGAYGVQAAAQTYFDKDVEDLTLGEAALLAGLPRRPSKYSPYVDPEEAKRRRYWVLHKMAQMGYITSEEKQAAHEEQIQSRLAELEEKGAAVYRAHHFTNLVIRELCADSRYGADAVYKGGLRVYTTLDMRLQRVAEQELTKGIERLRKQGRILPYPLGQGALAAVDVDTGDVLAMVGGVGDWEETQYNRAHPGPPQYGRQPGSSFKPYLFATAFESGYSPNSVFSGDPLRIGDWAPVNYSPGQGGNYTLKRALGLSVNLVAVRLIQAVGVRKTQRNAARILGIPEERLAPYPSLALGVSELSPLEQAIGYASFASGGLRPRPRFYHTIKDYTGETIEQRQPERVRVISKPAAISLLECLRYVVTNGTGRPANISGIACAGKTGTTQDHRDAWWVGITPDISCAVWVGNDNNESMRGASGSGFAAPIWREFIRQAHEILKLDGEYPEGSGVTATKESEPEEEEEDEEHEEQTDQQPEMASRTVTVCAVSGGAATPYCPDTYERKLLPGEAAPAPCSVHGPPQRSRPQPASSGSSTPGSRPRPADSGEGSSERTQPGTGGSSDGGTVSITICTQSGKPAGPYCPDTVERSFPAGSAPTGTCTIHRAPQPAPEPKPRPEAEAGHPEPGAEQPSGGPGSSEPDSEPPPPPPPTDGE